MLKKILIKFPNRRRHRKTLDEEIFCCFSKLEIIMTAIQIASLIDNYNPKKNIANKLLNNVNNTMFTCDDDFIGKHFLVFLDVLLWVTAIDVLLIIFEIDKNPWTLSIPKLKHQVKLTTFLTLYVIFARCRNATCALSR